MEIRVLILSNEAEYEKVRSRLFHDKHIVAHGSARNGFFVVRKNRLTGIEGVITAQQLTELLET